MRRRPLRLVAVAETGFGPVDLFFANAGIGGAPGLDNNDARLGAALEVKCSPTCAPRDC